MKRSLKTLFRSPLLATGLLICCASLGGCAPSLAMAPPADSSAPTPAAEGAVAAAAAEQPGAGAPGFAGSAPPGAPAPPPGQPPPPDQSVPSKAPATTSGGGQPSNDKAARVEEKARPLLIYEAQIGMSVKQAAMPAAIEALVDRAEELGGYLVSRTDNSVQVRVPSHNFRGALKSLGEIGEVTRRSVTAQDVSEEYHDLEVRLKNLEAVRQRLEQFLAKATNVSEALRVGQELERVGREIDVLKGRMQFLSSRAAYSLISVQLTPLAEPVIAGPSTPPPAKRVRLPVKWLPKLGVDELLDLEN